MFDTLADTFGFTGGRAIGLLFVGWWLPVPPATPSARGWARLGPGWLLQE